MSADDRQARLGEIAGRPVSRETIARLDAFETQFRRWAAHINLAAPSTLDRFWERHVLDSAQLLRFRSAARCWIDLGSGGGLPGGVIAAILAGEDAAEVHLIESNRKKAAFLTTALTAIGAPARVHARRIESCYEAIPACDVVTARALAPLETLIGLARPWLAAGASALFHKGRDYAREIAKSNNHDDLDLVEHASIVGADGVILEIRPRPLR